VAKKVMEKFPCRLLFITVKEGSKELKTQVSVISPHKEDSEVACDLLEIEISKDWQERVPFLILPHFVSDLPIYMVCRPYMDAHPGQVRHLITDNTAYLVDVDTEQDIQSLGLNK
jgi:hypothetical protein